MICILGHPNLYTLYYFLAVQVLKLFLVKPFMFLLFTKLPSEFAYLHKFSFRVVELLLMNLASPTHTAGFLMVGTSLTS